MWRKARLRALAGIQASGKQAELPEQMQAWGENIGILVRRAGTAHDRAACDRLIADYEEALRGWLAAG